MQALKGFLQGHCCCLDTLCVPFPNLDADDVQTQQAGVLLQHSQLEWVICSQVDCQLA